MFIIGIIAISALGALIYDLCINYTSKHAFRDPTPEEIEKLNLPKEEELKIFDIDKVRLQIFVASKAYYVGFPFIELRRILRNAENGE